MTSSGASTGEKVIIGVQSFGHIYGLEDSIYLQSLLRALPL